MEVDYVFLCGVIWCKYGEQDAGQELLRAADSEDGDMKALAGAMFEKGLRRLHASDERAHRSDHSCSRSR